METPQQEMEKSRGGHTLSSNLLISIFQEERWCKSCLQPDLSSVAGRAVPGESLLSMVTTNPPRLSPHSQNSHFVVKIVSVPAGGSTPSRTHPKVHWLL